MTNRFVVDAMMITDFKVLVTSRSFGREFKEPSKILEESGCKVKFATNFERPLTEEELLDLIVDVDGIIVGADKITRSVINKSNKLKVISKHGVGVDNIDLEAASKKGIVVTYVPDANYNAVADLTFGLMLAVARLICEADKTVRRGQWNKFIGTELWEKTLGVVGVGRIGKAVIRRARGFDMKVLAYDLLEDDASAREYKFDYAPLEDVLKMSDFVTMHVPLTEKTKGMIGEKELRMMKKTAYLINASRGEVVDEYALFRALSEKWIAGAALDVFKNEPPGDSPLLKLKNVVLTPHIGAYSYEAIKKMDITSAVNLLNVLKGEKPLYQINWP